MADNYIFDLDPLVTRAPVSYKNRGPGIYAQNMALRGFVALAFDSSFNGFSGGEPRHVSSPEIFAEDFSAGLFVAGERAFSRYFSEDAYELASEPKELHVVSNANHIDLYDQPDLIPFDKLEEFFTHKLASTPGLAVAEAPWARKEATCEQP